MSFSDPPPLPPPFLPPPFAGNIGLFQPQIQTNNAQTDLYPQYEQLPPFKKPRTSENNAANSLHLPPPANRQRVNGTSHIFFKTRICAKFMEGTCRNGQNCTFAHGEDDLREPPPNWQDLIREKERVTGNWNDDHAIIHRMKICKRFYNGEECPYGEKCNFLHEPPSKFKIDSPMRETAAISIQTAATGPMIESRTLSEQKPQNSVQMIGNTDSKPLFWKMRMCSKWEVTGQCPFREKCHFAHGQAELQVPVEADMMKNIGSVQLKPLSVPVEEAPPNQIAINRVEGKRKNNLSKWDRTKKLNHIYADWIDDLMPPNVAD